MSIQNLIPKSYRGGISLSIDSSFVAPYLHLVPDNYIQQQQQRDVKQYHLTIVSSQENGNNIVMPTEPMNVYIVGVGVNDDVYYLSCHVPNADTFRQQHKLAPKDFHITIGFLEGDKYNISKSIATTKHFVPSPREEIFNHLGSCYSKNIHMLQSFMNLTHTTPFLLKTLINQSALSGSIMSAIDLAYEYISSYPDHIVGYFMFVKLHSKANTLTYTKINPIMKELITSKQCFNEQADPNTRKYAD